MSMKDEYAAIILQRKEEDAKCLSELPDYWETSPAVKAEILLFTRDLQKTIDFLDHDITEDQFSWMSEVFEEISAKLQSWAFIDALNRAADRFPEECKKYCICPIIEFAIGQLSDEVYSERFPDADCER